MSHSTQHPPFHSLSSPVIPHEPPPGLAAGLPAFSSTQAHAASPPSHDRYGMVGMSVERQLLEPAKGESHPDFPDGGVVYLGLPGWAEDDVPNKLDAAHVDRARE